MLRSLPYIVCVCVCSLPEGVPACNSCVPLPRRAPGLLTFVNCMKVKWGAILQVASTVAKVLALILIIIAGLVQLARGERRPSLPLSRHHLFIMSHTKESSVMCVMC